MSYTPTTWQEGATKLGPTNLNHLELGVSDAHTAIAALQSASSKVLFVSSSGSDTNSGRNWAAALLTIQAAVDACAASGGVIYVEQGSYAPFTVTTSSTGGRTEVRGVGEAIVSVTGSAAIGITITGYGIVGPLI